MKKTYDNYRNIRLAEPNVRPLLESELHGILLYKKDFKSTKDTKNKTPDLILTYPLIKEYNTICC